MTDPIADMLTRIRNAYAAGKAEVRMPFSRLKAAVAQVLAKEGFVEQIETKGRLPQRTLLVVLKYIEGKPALEGLVRRSRPGQRQYLKSRAIRRSRYGFGVAILSTPQGVMSEKDAKKAGVGGEVLCEVW